jgi:outer membrane murein-binding lipoprotein Lpp
VTRISTLRAVLVGTAAIIGLQSAPVAAQPSPDQRINAIQEQIRALSNELKRVRSDLAAKDAAVRAAQEDAARARAQSESTQAAVASLRAPPGFAPGNGGTSSSGLDIGPGPARGFNPAGTGPFVPTDLKGGPGQPASPQGTPNGFGPGPTPVRGFNPAETGPLVSTDLKGPPPSGPPKGTFHIGGITVTLGGYAELAALYRTRNEVTDIGSSFNSIPLRNSPQYHEGEFRETARGSRGTILVQGDVDNNIHLAAFSEVDFQGSAPTANSNESNSYNPRLRIAYATLDDAALGVHVLAGQTWSLLNMFRKGLIPREEDSPLTIDSQLVPGFTWARQPQFRVTKDFDNQKFWLGASLENPQTTISAGTTTGIVGGTPNFSNLGVSNLNTLNSYSNNQFPDLIIKAAADPGWGHYEVFGILRDFDDRVSVVGGGHNNTRLAGGGGAGFILPLVSKILDFESRGIAGYGLGRYGSALLPDATLSQSGAVIPLPEYQVLAGLIGHPSRAVDLYTYVGTEQIGRASYVTKAGIPGGYGNPLYSNAGCDTELSTATCTANTSGITQGTIGGWYRPFTGDFGTVQLGAQYAYTKRAIFKGLTAVNGSGNKGTDENEVLVSVRYYPFQ